VNGSNIGTNCLQFRRLSAGAKGLSFTSFYICRDGSSKSQQRSLQLTDLDCRKMPSIPISIVSLTKASDENIGQSMRTQTAAKLARSRASSGSSDLNATKPSSARSGQIDAISRAVATDRHRTFLAISGVGDQTPI
jgi:hypothetical protein